MTNLATGSLGSEYHPALPPGRTHAGHPATGASIHFAPLGWEATDRGICPCGEAVRWHDDVKKWLVDRSLVILVLTADEAQHLRDDALMIEDLEPLLDLQLALNTDPEVPANLAPMTALETRAHDGDR